MVCFEGAGRTDGVCMCGYLREVARATAELSLLTPSRSLLLDKGKATGESTESKKSRRCNKTDSKSESKASHVDMKFWSWWRVNRFCFLASVEESHNGERRRIDWL